MVILLFASFLSFLGLSKRIFPSNSINLPTPTPQITQKNYQTSCQNNEDCILININDKNCCGKTGCEDFSTPNWIAVNSNWYKTIYQISCNDGPCPLAQCNTEGIRESFVARCEFNNQCVKLGGL